MHSSRDDSIAERLRRGSFTTDDIDRVALVTDGGAPGQPPTSGVLTVQAAPRGRRPAPRRSSLRLTPSQVMHGSLDSAGTTSNHVELSHAHHSVSTPALRPTVHGIAPPVVASFTRGGFAPTLPPPVTPLPPQGPTAVVTIPAAARPLSTSLGSVPRRPPPKRKTLAPSSTALGSFGASPSVRWRIMTLVSNRMTPASSNSHSPASNGMEWNGTERPCVCMCVYVCLLCGCVCVCRLAIRFLASSNTWSKPCT